eukprot:Ihof_evm1s411 gene=Ihof_evmTU1s411
MHSKTLDHDNASYRDISSEPLFIFTLHIYLLSEKIFVIMEIPLKEAIAKEKGFLITGGGGYLGLRLCQKLVALGARKVNLLDVRACPCSEGIDGEKQGCISFFTGDITKEKDVEEAMAGVSTVFHIASFGMSGREQLKADKIFAVNVGGTRVIVDTCRKMGVERLVYTSTTNVVFGSWPIINGDESLPYLPLARHCDNYSKSKSLAEQLLLGSSDPSLRTCALRIAGLYGDGEERHLPRIVSNLRAGLFRFVIGSESNKCEFIYVDNAVHAHLLAFLALGPKGPATGKPYFVSDACPINNFQFFRPVIEGLGYTYPTIRIPYIVAFYLAIVIEMLHRLIGPIYNFQPLLTRAEVNKIGVTHYFKQ